MINQEASQAVAATRLNAHIGKPLYDSYCFSQIPQAVQHVLTGEGSLGLPSSVLGELPQQYEKVILILVDGFGWRFFEQYGDRFPFLQRILQTGVASKLTTQFPSTTAAHVTTIHTGVPVGESGVYEWFYYEPLLDRIIAPLLYSFAGDKERETLKQTQITAQELYPTQTLYQRLAQQQIRSFCFQHQNYAHSPFSSVVCAGAEIVSFRTLPEAIVNLTTAAITTPGPAYFFFYIDSLDAIAHQYGPSSAQFEAEAHTFWWMMEQLFHQQLCDRLENTLLLITADHGQIEVSPEATIYLNHLVPSIEPLLKTNANGMPLVPAGSARDLFLYVQDDHLEKAEALLTEQLGDRATVYRTQTLVEEGYFGANPSSRLRDRLGNLVILPHRHETVWWYEKDRFEQRHRGHHGGLSAEEMETILLAMPYG
ncbi:MAG: alkaline phosphatase family protein [Elainellaceae cyanobacterium]